MQKFKGLRQASHFGPTLLVTGLSYFFSLFYWWEGPSFIVALGVFCGQLVVGWSNDLIDYRDDLSHNRQNKPLVSGLITPEFLQRALKITLPLAMLINLFGPLGFKGGGLSVLAIGVAVAYNFYFKFTVLSPFPYTFAFAALPSCMALSKDKLPPLWMWLGGALFGTAAHFINVLKDMEEDHKSGIKGLPQRIGSKGSIALSILLVAAGSYVVMKYFDLGL